MNTQGSQSSARQNFSMAEEDESGSLNPPFTLIKAVHHKQALKKADIKEEEEDDQEFSFLSEEGECEEEE